MATFSSVLPVMTVLLFKQEIYSVTLLISLAAGTRFLGDWGFWNKMFPQELKLCELNNSWRPLVKNTLSQSVAIRSLVDIVIDTGVDIFYIYGVKAIRFSISPLIKIARSPSILLPIKRS